MKYETAFANKQAELRKAYQQRGKVIWPASRGTMRLNQGLKGKAAKKWAKKLTHQKGYYRKQRELLLGGEV